MARRQFDRQLLVVCCSSSFRAPLAAFAYTAFFPVCSFGFLAAGSPLFNRVDMLSNVELATSLGSSFTSKFIAFSFTFLSFELDVVANIADEELYASLASSFTSLIS